MRGTCDVCGTCGVWGTRGMWGTCCEFVICCEYVTLVHCGERVLCKECGELEVLEICRWDQSQGADKGQEWTWDTSQHHHCTSLSLVRQWYEAVHYNAQCFAIPSRQISITALT